MCVCVRSLMCGCMHTCIVSSAYLTLFICVHAYVRSRLTHETSLTGEKPHKLHLFRSGGKQPWSLTACVLSLSNWFRKDFISSGLVNFLLPRVVEEALNPQVTLTIYPVSHFHKFVSFPSAVMTWNHMAMRWALKHKQTFWKVLNDALGYLNYFKVQKESKL